MVESLFVERLFTDGQLVAGQNVKVTNFVKVTKFKVYKPVAPQYSDLSLPKN